MLGLDPDKWYLTEHFVKRALQMGLTPDQIVDVLLYPDSIQKSRKHDGFNYRLGDLCFGVVPGVPNRVLTAVWSSREAWERDVSRGGYKDRCVKREVWS